MGSLLVNSMGPTICRLFGWRTVFYISASLCFILLAVHAALCSSSPSQCTRLSEAERHLLQAGGMMSKPLDQKVSRPLFPPLGFLLEPSIWVIFAAHFAQNWTIYFFDWLPLLYSSLLGTPVAVAGFHISALCLVELPARIAFTTLTGVPDLSKRTLQQHRKLMTCQGFALHSSAIFAIVCLILSGAVWPVAFTVLFALGKSSHAFHSGGYFANYLDRTKQFSGTLSGVGNMVATVSGVIFPRFAAGTTWTYMLVSIIFFDLVAALLVAKGLRTDCLDTKFDAATKDDDTVVPESDDDDLSFCEHYSAVSCRQETFNEEDDKLIAAQTMRRLFSGAPKDGSSWHRNLTEPVKLDVGPMRRMVSPARRRQLSMETAQC